MNSILVLNNNFTSKIKNEDFIPIKVDYNVLSETIKYIGFYYKDTDLLEFSVDIKTNKIVKFQLVLCNHFEIFNTNLVSSTEYEEGCICINLPQHNNCKIFNVQVFNNALKITLSNSATNRQIKCGQVLFGLSSENDLVEVSILEMSENDIAHTKDELQHSIE